MTTDTQIPISHEKEILAYIKKSYFAVSFQDLCHWLPHVDSKIIRRTLDVLTNRNQLDQRHHPTRRVDVWKPSGQPRPQVDL